MVERRFCTPEVRSSILLGSTRVDKHIIHVVLCVCSFHYLNYSEGNLMSIKPNASIFETSSKYRLYNAALTNEEIASHLSGDSLRSLINSGEIAYENQGQPPGTFWAGGNGMTWGYLIAVRTAENEIVFLWPFFHSKLEQVMLAIAEPIPS